MCKVVNQSLQILNKILASFMLSHTIITEAGLMIFMPTGAVYFLTPEL